MSHLYPDYNWHIRLQDLSPIIVNQNPFLFLLFLVLPVVSRTVANTERKENLSDFSPFLLNQVRRLVWRDPDSWGGGIKLSSPILSTVACLCKPNHTTREMRRGRDALNVYLCSPKCSVSPIPSDTSFTYWTSSDKYLAAACCVSQYRYANAGVNASAIMPAFCLQTSMELELCYTVLMHWRTEHSRSRVGKWSMCLCSIVQGKSIY